MEKFKKILLKILYPHIVVVLLCVISSITLVICSLIMLGITHPLTIFSYALSSYTLIIVCLRIPNIIKGIKRLKTENQYIFKWRTDNHLRIKVGLILSFVFNTIYAIFQFGIGLYHGSFWFYSISIYYLLLAIMRLILMKHIFKNEVNEKPKTELIKYCVCGWLMLVLNLALSLIIFFMVYWNRSFVHHEITTIALAGYTFLSFTFAVINYVKYKKLKSPVYSAAKAISLTSACVSIITLEATMLTAFGSTLEIGIRKILLGVTGAIVWVFVILLAINIIVHGMMQLKQIKKNNLDK